MASIVSPIAQPSGPKSVSRPKRWSEEVEEAYRFQIAGYRDVHEYRDVKQKEPVSSSRFYLLQECVLFYFLVMTLKTSFLRGLKQFMRAKGDRRTFVNEITVVFPT